MAPRTPSNLVEITATAAPGGPAAAVAAALEQGLTAAIRAARSDNTIRLSALNLELTGGLAAAETLVVHAWVERATRTLAFVSADVFAGERRVATGGGVFELS